MNTPWASVRLGDVLQQRKEFITIDDLAIYKRPRVQLHARGITLRDEIPGALIKTKAQQVCQGGEFLVAEIDAKVGGFGIVPELLNGAIVSSHYFLFPVDDTKLDRRFLDYFARTPGFRDQIEAQGSTNYAAIRPADVLRYEIPLPPLPEQRRIVARIEELAAKIEEARNLRRTTVIEANELFASAITAACDDKMIWGTVREAVLKRKGSVRSGPFGSQLLHEEFVETGVAAIGTRDVQTNRFELKSGWHVTPEKFKQLQHYQVFSGDVLCTIVGASIGRFCVVPEDPPVAFTTKHVQALTLDRDNAKPCFVSYMLNYHRRCRESLFSQVEGSAQPSLNAEKILATHLPLPPLSEQRRVVVELDALQTKTDELKRLQAETAAELDALLPSILDKAFKGAL
ncbi:MAG: restriction endonuclease subunit S [candidate division NC10 bacterium]|nr:restriction endonuclease subunit S [candidate division NC10 bacterium]